MKYLIGLFLLLFSLGFSQENNIFERVSAVNNNGKIWYNIDGYSVTSEVFNYNFDEKGLKKVFRKHKISDSESKTKDENIHHNNFFVTTQQNISDNIFQTNNYYFVENPNKKITVVWFIKNGKTDKETEQKLVNSIVEDKVPQANFVPMQINSINFAGSKIEIGNSCYWTSLNTVQCPYMGEMNWSLHRNIESAQEAIENQLNLTKSRKNIQIISEEMVDVEFEGVATQAKKVVFDLKGVTSLLTGMSGGETLTTYYIAENVRNQNVSCVMSFWNNDQINPDTKLPPLLEALMVLK